MAWHLIRATAAGLMRRPFRLRRGLVASISLAAALSLALVRAQSQAYERATFRDSVSTRIVLASLISALHHDLSRGAQDSSTIGFDLVFPAGPSPIDWQAIQRELTRLLRARPLHERDTLRLALTVTAARVTEDSLAIDFTTSGHRRCPGTDAWIGSSTGYEVRMAWAQFTFTPEARPVEFGDTIGCLPPAPRTPPRR